MLPEKSWEDETLELLHDTQGEKQRAHQRLVAAEKAIKSLEGKIAGIQLSLNAYRTKYGLPATGEASVDRDEVQAFLGKRPKEMIRVWAGQHQGEIVMKEAGRFLTAAGLFQDERQAAGTLYRTIKRMEDEFTKERPGYYRKIRRVSYKPSDFAHDPDGAEGETTTNELPVGKQIDTPPFLFRRSG